MGTGMPPGFSSPNQEKTGIKPGSRAKEPEMGREAKGVTGMKPGRSPCVSGKRVWRHSGSRGTGTEGNRNEGTGKGADQDVAMGRYRSDPG